MYKKNSSKSTKQLKRTKINPFARPTSSASSTSRLQTKRDCPKAVSFFFAKKLINICIYRKFAVPLHRNAKKIAQTINSKHKTIMKEPLTTKQKLRKIFVNKYAITLYLFAIIYLFVGNQSLVKRLAKAREIREIKQEIQLINQQTQAVENMLNSLDNKDSLERYAREHYQMHEDGEVVYLID